MSIENVDLDAKPDVRGTETADGDRPYVPADQVFPEITIKAVVLGVLLSVLLAGANAYLGLLAGLTVSASIPAAVISMAVLRFFSRRNILENNIVQTAASAGESLAAGVIFTFPALVIMKAWTDFDYLQTTVIAALGGLIGVLFTIPLRRVLVTDRALLFPEGVATAEVLKVGDRGGSGVLNLVIGAIFGAVYKLGQAGLQLWTGAVGAATRVGSSVFALSTDLLPSLLAVGYIVGLNIAVLVAAGGFINWLICIPIYSAIQPPDAFPPDEGLLDYAGSIWSTKTRFIGVGAMIVGGLWTLARLIPRLVRGLKLSVGALRTAKANGSVVLRTERDTPMGFVALALILAIGPLVVVFHMATSNWAISGVMAILMLVAGFLFSAVAAYMAGLVGSSNNPISGVTIATVLISSLLLVLMMGQGNADGAVAAIMIAAVVCCAAAIGGDNIQDLKAGHRLGATPRNQQIMQFVGVIAASLVMAPVLSLLYKAYGFVEKADPNQTQEALAAPQATLMASVAQGVFRIEGQSLPWALIGIGALLAVAIIALDLVLERRKAPFRAYIMAVAVGLYLPLELEVPILFGGLISFLASRLIGAGKSQSSGDPDAEAAQATRVVEARERGQRSGILFAAGLITGEAVLGILQAIPIAARDDGKNPLSVQEPEGWFFIEGYQAVAWPGLTLMITAMVILLVTTLRAARTGDNPPEKSLGDPTMPGSPGA